MFFLIQQNIPYSSNFFLNFHKQCQYSELLTPSSPADWRICSIHCKNVPDLNNFATSMCQNVKAFVVCGFLIKYKKKIMLKILPDKQHSPGPYLNSCYFASSKINSRYTVGIQSLEIGKKVLGSFDNNFHVYLMNGLQKYKKK